MVSSNYWANQDPDYHNEDQGRQTFDQHFPPSITQSDDVFANMAPLPHVTINCGSVIPSSLPDQSMLLEALQRQTTKLSLLMNQLPTQLYTPTPTPLSQPSYTGPPDFLSAEYSAQFTPRANLPQNRDMFTPLTPLPSSIASRCDDADYFDTPAPLTPARAQHSSSASTTTHLTNPEAGHYVNIAPHHPHNRIPFSAATNFPPYLPVRVRFLRRFQHSRSRGLQGQIIWWHLELAESYPGSFME
jgi:hypothetical protein